MNDSTEMVREEEKSRWWWFETHKSSKHSLWLQSTLAELDAKTKAMLKLIEGNADSFAQRAETYYKKRPELITIVQDFYRAHRSLAERFDHLKSSDYGSRSSKFHQDTMESVCDRNSQFEDADSEIEDPVGEVNEPLKLEQERLKLMEERDALRKQLLDKDEEKREVIRQLALSLETLKDENLRVKRRLGHESLEETHRFRVQTTRQVLQEAVLHYVRWQQQGRLVGSSYLMSLASFCVLISVFLRLKDPFVL